MTSLRVEAGTQTRQMPGTQYRMPATTEQHVVRETVWAGSGTRLPAIREKKPNGDPCSLTLWGAEEE